jgi:hypothetical protein
MSHDRNDEPDETDSDDGTDGIDHAVQGDGDDDDDDDDKSDKIPSHAKPADAALSLHLRSSLKIVRDPSRTAYDLLPTGETLGSFANRQAVDRYARKVEQKRHRAAQTREQQRKQTKAKKRKIISL